MSYVVCNWDKVNLKDPDGLKKMIGAINHFAQAPDKNPYVRRALQLRGSMQHFTTAGDFPDEVLPLIEKFHQMPAFDNAYEQIFNVQRFTTGNGFDMADVASGLTFSEIPVGGKVKLYKMAGERTHCYFARYGAGMHWDRSWFEDNTLWNAEDSAMEFTGKFYHARATAFYALIDAIDSSQNLAWQSPTPSALANTDARYIQSRDANTINKACETILLALKDSGVGATPQAPFIILAPIQLRGRIEQALAYADLTLGGKRPITYNVTPLYTMMLSDSTKYYVALPGRKNKAGYRQDLTLFAKFDELTYTDMIVGWGRFGGAIGDIEQFQRCATA